MESYVHTITDIATLVFAVGSSAMAMYRGFSDRVRLLEERVARIEAMESIYHSGSPSTKN